MKKRQIITLLSGSLLLITASCSQKSIDFNCKFLSNREYTQTTTSNTKNEVRYSGDEQFVQQMLSKNSENPQKTESNSTIITSITSGIEQNGSIPITLEYIETGKDDPDGLLLNGDKFYGNYSEAASFKIDSTSSKRLSLENRDMFFLILEKGYETLIFDGKRMEIGDSLQTRTPMSIPVSGQNIELEIVSTYILKKIKNKLAKFDIRQVAVLLSDFEQIEFSATGIGNGHCIYSIDHQYLVKNTTTFEIKMNFKIDETMSFEINGISLSDAENKIREIE